MYINDILILVSNIALIPAVLTGVYFAFFSED
jgi:hypothetical protein